MADVSCTFRPGHGYAACRLPHADGTGNLVGGGTYNIFAILGFNCVASTEALEVNREFLQFDLPSPRWWRLWVCRSPGTGWFQGAKAVCT